MRSWARAFPPRPALMFPHLAAGGPSAPEPCFEGSLPLCVPWALWPLPSLPCPQGCAAFRTQRGRGCWVCKPPVANGARIPAVGRESAGKAGVWALLFL